MNTRLFLCVAVAIIVFPFTRAMAEGEVSLQFLSFPHQLEREPIELVIGEEETLSIEIPSNELSPFYKVKRLASIVVGIKTVNEKGQSAFQVLGKAASLASSNQIIVLMRKGEHNSDGFVVLPIDSDQKDFPGGNYLFINASKELLAGKIGDKNLQLTPGEREMLKPGASHEGGGCQVTLFYKKGEKSQIFFDTRWSVSPRYRSLVFIYPSPTSGNLSVSLIVDIL
jgi:hypothetical protein